MAAMEGWPFGIEHAPSGERCREYVQRLPVWSSGIFISEHGGAYRRYLTRQMEASWEAIPLAEDESGRFGYHLPGFVSVEHAIATAWHERAPGSRCHAYVLDPSVEVHASNIAWREPDVVLLDDVVGEERWGCPTEEMSYSA